MYIRIYIFRFKSISINHCWKHLIVSTFCNTYYSFYRFSVFLGHCLLCNNKFGLVVKTWKRWIRGKYVWILTLKHIIIEKCLYLPNSVFFLSKVEVDEPDFGLIGTYQVLGRILKMKTLRDLIIVLLTCKVTVIHNWNDEYYFFHMNVCSTHIATQFTTLDPCI